MQPQGQHARHYCFEEHADDVIRDASTSTEILGVRVSAVTLEGAIGMIQSWVQKRHRTYVCVTGVHGVMESRRDQGLRRIHNTAGLVTPDGMPLVWLSRLYGRTQVQRVCGRDLLRGMTVVSAKHGYRQFYYGGADGIAETLARELSARYPDLQVAGTFCPPFRPLTPEEDEAIVALINAARPDILWIGLSTPKQERWMASHLDRLDVPVMIGVGAAFDFVAGTLAEAPAWMQRSGLEWLFRFYAEPRRLWRRYAQIVPGFIVLAGVEFTRRSALALVGQVRAWSLFR